MADIDSKLKTLEKSKQQAENSGPPEWKAGQKKLENLMAVVVIVLFIGFASMFVAVASLVINASGEKHASYQQLESQVQSQNTKIDELTKSLQK